MVLVPYHEVTGSPTFSLTRRGLTAKRTLHTNWNYVDALVAELTPYPGNIFATFPGRPLFVVDTIDIAPAPGLDPDGQNEIPASYVNGGDFGAKVEVTYKTPEWDSGTNSVSGDTSPRGGGDPKADNQTLLSHKVSVSGEFIVLPTRSMRWEIAYDARNNIYGVGTDRVSGDVSAGILVPLIEHDITWHYVLFPPWTAIRSCIGKVNRLPFAGAPRGTLLFLGCEANVDIASYENKYWTVTYKFAYKNNRLVNGWDAFDYDKGWNYFLRPESGQFELLLRRPPASISGVPDVMHFAERPSVDSLANLGPSHALEHARLRDAVRKEYLRNTERFRERLQEPAVRRAVRYAGTAAAPEPGTPDPQQGFWGSLLVTPSGPAPGQLAIYEEVDFRPLFVPSLF